MRLVPDLSNPACAIRQHGIQGPARRIAPARQQEGKPIQLIQNGLGDQCVVQNKIVRGIRRTGARITSPSPSFSESQSIRFLLASPCRTSKPPKTPYDEGADRRKEIIQRDGSRVVRVKWLFRAGQWRGSGNNQVFPQRDTLMPAGSAPTREQANRLQAIPPRRLGPACPICCTLLF